MNYKTIRSARMTAAPGTSARRAGSSPDAASAAFLRFVGK